MLSSVRALDLTAKNIDETRKCSDLCGKRLGASELHCPEPKDRRRTMTRNELRTSTSIDASEECSEVLGMRLDDLTATVPEARGPKLNIVKRGSESNEANDDPCDI